MKKPTMKILLVIILLLGGIYYATPSLASPGEMRTFKLEKGRSGHVNFYGLEMDIPAGATDKELSVGWGDPDLTQIQVPFGFRPVSQPYRFGPHGLKFQRGKAPIVRLKINADSLREGDSFRSVRLYYINREEKRLELTKNQQIDPVTGNIEAELDHFSEYVLGISSNWDGNGFCSNMDYVSDGEEHVLLNGLKLNILSPVFPLSGRGKMGFDLVRVYKGGGIDSSNPFYIAQGWYWAMPYIYKERLYLANGASYDLSHGNLENIIPLPPGFESNDCIIKPECTHLRYCGDSRVKVIYKGYNWDSSKGRYKEKRISAVILKDGTSIEKHSGTMIVRDPNGNTIQYGFAAFGNSILEPIPIDNDNSDAVIRLTSLTDSAGRSFKFSYDLNPSSNGTINPTLSKVEQKLSDNTYRCILSYRKIDANSYCFTDALGKVTSYYAPIIISQITHYDGSRTNYEYDFRFDAYAFIGCFTVKSQKVYRPGESNPFTTITYSPSWLTGQNAFSMSSVAVNDGTSLKKYYFNNPDYGTTSKEETYTLSGNLVKSTTYTYKLYGTKEAGANVPISINTQFMTASGTLGPAASFQYDYDDWCNPTLVKDPNGNITRMAYANTNSNWHLSQLNGGLQDYCFSADLTTLSEIGYDKLLTKATINHDPVHNTDQLNQTHYQYDARGNLLRERNAYNGSYLESSFTYDSYGNILSKTDANGNALYFEYRADAPYNSAFLTAVKKADGSAIATYDYDVNIGKPTRVTDPKGNLFLYTYDTLGRLTSETLDNADPKIGITRQITYDDANSTVSLKYGNIAAGWQEGRILYDPLCGKPRRIQRKLNGNWVTLKELSYDSAGRLISAKDNLGHTTSYNYDELDRLIKTTLPDGTFTTSNWNDRTLTVIDAKGNQRVQTYDRLDRLIQVIEHPDSNTSYVTTYDYDSESHLVRVTNPRQASTLYTYDNLGRQIRIDLPQDGTNPMAAEIYTYDNVGNLKTKTIGSRTKTMNYEFFAGYRLKSLTEPDSRTVTYTYDNNDNPLTQTVSNGMSYTYAYDSRNR
ncbi:YD repeat-containing protein, partial [Hydrogenispora ethanolica]